MIAIIDYGMGNLRSVEKALQFVGAEGEITRDYRRILAASHVVLPGVGAFGEAMANLRRGGLVGCIEEVIQRNTPFLGICLGLQLLFDGSEEDEGVAGLGIIKGMVKKIPDCPGLKIPHMGWNTLDNRGQSPVVSAAHGQHVYFVHSYHGVPVDGRLVTAVTDYGGKLTAAVGKEMLQAVQFHPEKSGQVGLAMLQRFKELGR